MVQVYRHTLMVTNMKECLKRVKNQVKVHIIMLKDKYIKANGSMVKYKVSGYVNGLMESIIKGIG